MSVILGLDVTTTCLLIGVPTAIYTMFGGVQAVAWTDVKQMCLIVVRPGRGGGGAGARPARHRRLRRRLAPRRHDRPAAGVRFLVRPDRDATRSGPACSAALFLFLSYFGTDQSQVQRYLTAKSVDEARTSLLHERLLEDSAAGAGAADRRADVRVLPVHAAADAVQSRARRARAESARAAEYAALRAALRRGDRRAPHGGRSSSRRRGAPATARDRGGRAAFAAGSTRSRRSAPRRWRSCKHVSGDTHLQRRQLRVPDLHHRRSCRLG